MRPARWDRETCPDAGREHTPVPVGYVERSEDAELRLAEGQQQVRCPTCGRWAVWLRPDGARAQGSGP